MSDSAPARVAGGASMPQASRSAALPESAQTGAAAQSNEHEGESIEERRQYTLRFADSDALASAYQGLLQACQSDVSCRSAGSGMNRPKHGQANAWVQLGIERAGIARNPVISQIEQSDNLESTDISLENRSREMIDAQARLKQKEALRDRLVTLSQQAREYSQRNLQDLLQIERELARVQGEIESMQGQLRHLARVTERVNVRVELRQDRWSNEQVSVFTPLRSALDESASLFFRSLGNVILAIVFLTPWMVLGVPAIWLLAKTWKGLKRLVRRRAG